MGGIYDPPLNIELHLKYWRRCFRSSLPHHYLSYESNRMTLAFFMVGALDILPTPPAIASKNASKPPQEPIIRPEDKPLLREWVLAQQHAEGGFSGSPSMVFPAQMDEEWDFAENKPGQERAGRATLPSTVFALQLLASLTDENAAESAFDGVDRAKTLRWLRKLQREDGSFGEVLAELPGKGWLIGGGYDMRLCYLAAMIRWMLRGDVQEGHPAWVEDFNTDKLVKYISSTQTYDGGLAGSMKDEPHAGYAYCAVAALSLLDRPLEGTKASHPSKKIQEGIPDIPALVRWLVSRQLVYIESAHDVDEDDSNAVQSASLEEELALDEKTTLVGFNGRCNKVADTCYTWWAASTLANLGQHGLIAAGPARGFLLEKTQHIIGGFGKKAGSPPDVYHSFLGLAVLSIMGEPGLNEVDTSLAVTVRTVRKIEKARVALLKRVGEGVGGESTRQKLAELEDKLNAGEKLAWLDAVGA